MIRDSTRCLVPTASRLKPLRKPWHRLLPLEDPAHDLSKVDKLEGLQKVIMRQ